MYGMQVKVYNEKTHKMEWRWVRPTDGEPYVFETKQQAEQSLDLCYPLSDVAGDERRVKEFAPECTGDNHGV